MEKKRSGNIQLSFCEHLSSSSPDLGPLYAFGEHPSSGSLGLIPCDTFGEHLGSNSLGHGLPHLLEEHSGSSSSSLDLPLLSGEYSGSSSPGLRAQSLNLLSSNNLCQSWIGIGSFILSGILEFLFVSVPIELTRVRLDVVSIDIYLGFSQLYGC